MVKFRNANSCVLVVAVAVVLCTGCSRSKFSCDSDNLMGFEGYSDEYLVDLSSYLGKSDIKIRKDTSVRLVMLTKCQVRTRGS